MGKVYNIILSEFLLFNNQLLQRQKYKPSDDEGEESNDENNDDLVWDALRKTLKLVEDVEIYEERKVEIDKFTKSFKKIYI